MDSHIDRLLVGNLLTDYNARQLFESNIVVALMPTSASDISLQASSLQASPLPDSLLPSSTAETSLAPVTRIKLAEGLTEFPAELYQHADTLEHLDLSDNQLSSLPADFGRFVALKRLFLTNNQFEYIPEVLASCQSLTMVSFRGNQLTRFAEGSLPEGLEWLILTDNKLSQLPEDFGRYRRLKKLALSGNQLSALPESMAHCRELGLARLSLNRFEAFPDWLFELPKLAWLALGANPATPVSNHSCIPTEDIANYLLDAELGTGASGTIYLAHHKGSTEPVALKKFKGWLTSDGCPKDELNNALNAGLHPNLIPIVANISGLELPAMVMQLIPNTFQSLGMPPSFATITRDTYKPELTLSRAQIITLARQVSSAMAHLHGEHICHGDLYSHNMLVNEASMLYLGDFGAATALESLPAHQADGFKKLEVRAFGYWLDEMLSRLRPEAERDSPEADSDSPTAKCDSPAANSDSQEPKSDDVLITLREQCLMPSVSQRPDFGHISERLHLR